MGPPWVWVFLHLAVTLEHHRGVPPASSCSHFSQMFAQICLTSNFNKKKTTTQLIHPAVWHQASLCMTSMDYKRNSNSPNRYPGSTLRWTNHQEVSQLTPHSLCSSAVTCFYQRWRQIPKLHSVDLNSGVLIHDCELQINYIVCGCFTVSCKKYSAGYILLSLTLNQSSLVPPQQTHRMNGFNYAFYSVPCVGTTNPTHMSEADDFLSLVVWLHSRKTTTTTT